MFAYGRFDSVFAFTALFSRLLLPYQPCELVAFLILFIYFLSSEFFKHSS
jgi:hypothetical protein